MAPGATGGRPLSPVRQAAPNRVQLRHAAVRGLHAGCQERTMITVMMLLLSTSCFAVAAWHESCRAIDLEEQAQVLRDMADAEERLYETRFSDNK
jgi:hypothetical protein